MSTKQGPAHVVVDGSNIATEGRSMPSLAQLSEAVGSFMEEHPDTAITVVVDATFGHRIDKKEVPEFEDGIANNELVAPPAGAVGRGDAFVLGIADKAGSSVLSNDSFQEFHAEYLWLFDEGRLIGGKPVPHVGWVWVNRVPVRGPVSRKATRGTGNTRRSSGRSRRGGSRDEFEVRTGSADASAPMPKPKSPPPGRSRSGDKAEAPVKESVAKAAPRGSEPVNDLMPFLEFVEHHPVGSSVNGTVDAYSSHGAYITIVESGVRGYIPLRMMASPTPRSAKSVMKIDESVTVVVVSFAAARRSIDCAVPDMAAEALAAAKSEGTDHVDAELVAAEASTSTRRRRSGSATKKTAVRRNAATGRGSDDEAGDELGGSVVTAKPRTAKKRTANKKAATKKTVVQQPATKKTATKRTPAKKTATKRAPAKKAPPKRTAAKQQASGRSANAPTPSTTAAKNPTVKKSVAKQGAAKKAAPKKAAAKQAPTKKAAPKKSAARKGAKKVAAKADQG